MKEKVCTSEIAHLRSSSYGLNTCNYADLSPNVVLLVRAVLKMWLLAEVHGDAADVTFVLLFLFSVFFFSF